MSAADRARKKRTANLTSEDAATVDAVSAALSGKQADATETTIAAAPAKAATEKKNIILPTAVVFRVEDARLAAARNGAPVSWAGFVEVALRALLDQGEDAIMAGIEKYGAKRRR